VPASQRLDSGEKEEHHTKNIIEKKNKSKAHYTIKKIICVQWQKTNTNFSHCVMCKIVEHIITSRLATNFRRDMKEIGKGQRKCNV